jgi:hypothetical protein
MVIVERLSLLRAAYNEDVFWLEIQMQHLVVVDVR